MVFARRSRLHPSLRCPQCEQAAFVLPPDPIDHDTVESTICQCCGHVMEKDDIVAALKDLASTEVKKALRR